MSTNRKPSDGAPDTDEVIVTFRTSKRLRDDYAAVVKRNERTPSQALRLHMAQTVAEARDENGDLPVAA